MDELERNYPFYDGVLLDAKFFENEDEIPGIIEKALQNEELCLSLSKNARAYFEQNVHPKENIKRILIFMLQNNNNV